jgi:hypothetical protein
LRAIIASVINVNLQYVVFDRLLWKSTPEDAWKRKIFVDIHGFKKIKLNVMNPYAIATFLTKRCERISNLRAFIDFWF